MLKRLIVLLLLIGVVLSLGGSSASSAELEPYLVQTSKKSGYWKSHVDQSVNGSWQILRNGSGPYGFDLNGKRTLFFVQLHLTCSKKPRYVKIQLARVLPSGKLDTTGTNTWVVGSESTPTWQGSFWWESKTKYPIIARFKVVGGKCFSPQRQFKWWQP